MADDAPLPAGYTLDAPVPDGYTLDAAPAAPKPAPYSPGFYGRGPMPPGVTPSDVSIDNTTVGRVLDAFGQGAKYGWGTDPLGLSAESEQFLRKIGVFNDYNSGNVSVMRSFNQALIRPAATTLDAVIRGTQAAFGAVVGGGEQALMETGVPQALEKFGNIAPEDPTKNIASNVQGAVDQANVIAALSGAAPEALFAGGLNTSRSLGVTRSEAAYAGSEVGPVAKVTEIPGVQAPPVPAAAPPTIAQAALKVGDKVFTGTDHASALEAAVKAGIPEDTAAQGVNGFTTSAGDFVDRQQAVSIANQSGQQARVVEGGVTSQGTTSPSVEELTAATTPEARADLYKSYGLDTEGKPLPSSEAVATPAAPQFPPTPSKVDVPVTPVQAFDDMPKSTGGTKLNLNYDSPQDIQDFLRQQAIAAGDFASERRSGTSWAETERLGQAMGLKPQDIISREVGQIHGASWMDAATNTLIESTQNVKTLWQKAASGTDADKLAALEAEAQHSMLMASVVGNEAEVGRALNILRKFKQTTQEARDVATILKDEGGIENLAERARLGSMLDTPQQVSSFIRDSMKPKLKDMLMEAWVNALLSGPVTLAKNAAGNLTTALWRTTESGVAAGIGLLRGAPEDRVLLGEAYQRLYAFVNSGPEMIKAGWKAWKEDAGGSKLDHPKMQAIPSIRVNIAGHDFLLGGKQVRIPGRILSATDQAFKVLAYRQSVAAQAWRRAAKGGATGDAFTRQLAALTQNPTVGMMERASKEADLQTLTQALGKYGQAAQTLANANVLTKMIAPFVKFGINAAKFAGERSIFSVMNPEVRRILSGADGAAARDEQIAKIVVGSAVSGTAIYMASQGKVTGQGPKDPGERALLRQTGWQPYSIKVGDTYYAGNWDDPASTVFFVAADAYEIGDKLFSQKHESAGKFASNMAELVMGSVVNNITSKTYLQGISNAIDVMNDPGRYGEQWLQKQAGTVVPTGVAQAARLQDPYLRDARTIADTLRSRLPKTPLNPEFNSESVFPVRDIWGNAIKRGDAAGPDIISPVYTSGVNNDPVTQELLSLGVFPAKLDRQIRGVDLTPRQYDDYQRVAGKLLQQTLQQTMQMPKYGELPPGVRGEVMARMINRSREVARNYILMAYPQILQDATSAKIKDLSGQ